MSRPEGYDKPHIPDDTPPAIDPDVEPRSSEEMEEDGESEEDQPLGNRSDPDQIDTEMTEKLRRREDRAGDGEKGLDHSGDVTKLPPD